MALGFLRGRHQRLREQLSAYADDELPPAERFEIEHHLETCSACREEIEELRTIAWATSQLPEVTVPRSFALTAAMAGNPASLRPVSVAGPPSASPSWYLFGWAAAGIAALVLGAGVAHLLTRPSQPPSTDVIARVPPTTVALTATATPTPPPTSTATPTITVAATGTPIAVARAPSESASGSSAPQSFTPIAPAGQPGGTVNVPLPNRPGAPPAAATSSATAVGAVVTAPSSRGNPGATPSPVAAAAAPAAAPINNPPQVISGGAAAPSTAGAPVVIGSSPGTAVLIPPPNAASAGVAAAPVAGGLPVTPSPTATRSP